MEKKFNIGDVVVLKSGGNTMTVAEYTPDGFVICEWFINNNTEVKSHKFNQDQLEVYTYRPSISFGSKFNKNSY